MARWERRVRRQTNSMADFDIVMLDDVAVEEGADAPSKSENEYHQHSIGISVGRLIISDHNTIPEIMSVCLDKHTAKGVLYSYLTCHT